MLCLSVLRAQMAAHQDSINGLDICVRNERTLILSASADCSAALWDIDGKQIGVFGQVTQLGFHFKQKSEI